MANESKTEHLNKIPLLGLRLVGLCPSRKRTILDKLHVLFVWINLALNAVTSSFKLPTCKGHLNCLMQNFTFSILFYTTVYCYSSMLMNEKIYISAVENLEMLMKKFKTETRTARVEFLIGRVCLFCMILANFGILYYLFTPLFLYKECVKNIPEYTTMTCGLPAPISVPFNYSDGVGFYAAFCLQCFWTYPYIYSIVFIVIFCASINSHVVGHLLAIQDNLTKIGEKAEDRFESLRNCVQHHIEILDFQQSLAPALNQLLFMYATLISIILSMLGFQMLQMFLRHDVTDIITYMIVINGWFGFLTIMSFVGQNLMDESINVSDAAYEIPWYEENMLFKKLVLQIMTRAQKPLIIRTASIGSASLENFTKIMSQTYSYLTILYNTVLSPDEKYHVDL